jgi:hypothetical protein
MALSTTTILARLMPCGAPSTPSAKGRFDQFAMPSGNDRYLREADGWSRREADIAEWRAGTSQFAAIGPTRFALD